MRRGSGLFPGSSSCRGPHTRLHLRISVDAGGLQSSKGFRSVTVYQCQSVAPQKDRSAPTGGLSGIPRTVGGYGMMRVLLIEDDTAMAALTEQVLQEGQFIVDCTDLGEDGLEIGKLYDYDIIILDLTLPDIDGYEVLRRLRAARVRTPVLIMSGRTGIDAKIKALDAGADDFMTKPFNGDELIARIQAVVRRSQGHPQSLIRTGKLVVDIDHRI